MPFQASPEVAVIREILVNLRKGDHISYLELSARIGSDVKTKAVSALNTARRHLIHQGCKFECVDGGLTRLDDKGVIRVGQSNLQWIQHKARRTFQHTTLCVENYERLANDDKQRFDVVMAVTGVIAHSLRPKTLERLAPFILHETQTQNKRALGETIDAIKNLIA